VPSLSLRRPKEAMGGLFGALTKGQGALKQHRELSYVWIMTGGDPAGESV